MKLEEKEKYFDLACHMDREHRQRYPEMVRFRPASHSIVHWTWRISFRIIYVNPITSTAQKKAAYKSLFMGWPISESP
jgi:hypothetical protein